MRKCVRDRAKALLSDLAERGSSTLTGGGWVEARACFEQALGCSDSAEAMGFLGLLVA